jgi:hypothetical protein
MKANELRIGNYVQFPSGLEYEVDIIYKDYVMLKNWNPITLTENWLLKLGFTYDQETYVFERKGIKIEVIDNHFIFNYFYGIKYLKYVHELQNLCYYLTNN